MKIRTYLCAQLLLALVTLGTLSTINSAAHAAFLEPTAWAVGDVGSTYQLWQAGGSSAVPITTNVTSLANPVLAAPVFSQTGGFVASSGGLYSFSGNYSFTADINNHGVEPGTWVRVQTASTVNPDYDPEEDGTGGSVLRNSITILDASDNVLAVSDPLDVIRTFYDDNFPLFGGVGYEQLIWEVFLPGYTGNFSVTGFVMVHASLQALRVDSMNVPEPATCAGFAMGLVGVVLMARRRRAAQVNLAAQVSRAAQMSRAGH